MISDSVPTDDDVQMCLNQMKNRRGGKDVLSKKEANKMRKGQDDLVTNYTYTTQDIQKSVAAKKTLSKNISNIGAEKTKAAIAVDAAELQLEEAQTQLTELEMKLLEVDAMEEEAVQDELDVAKSRVGELEEELKKKKVAQEKIHIAEASRTKRMKNSEKNQNWAKVNERAKAANKAADVTAYKGELGARRDGLETGPKDLFARRKVKPKILWEVGQTMEEESNKVAVSEEAARDDSNNNNKGQDESRERINSRKAKLADQINDLAIEEEALTAGLNGAHNKKIAATRVRKGISIQEYLERKGITA